MSVLLNDSLKGDVVYRCPTCEQEIAVRKVVRRIGGVIVFPGIVLCERDNSEMVMARKEMKR